MTKSTLQRLLLHSFPAFHIPSNHLPMDFSLWALFFFCAGFQSFQHSTEDIYNLPQTPIEATPQSPPPGSISLCILLALVFANNPYWISVGLNLIFNTQQAQRRRQATTSTWWHKKTHLQWLILPLFIACNPHVVSHPKCPSNHIYAYFPTHRTGFWLLTHYWGWNGWIHWGEVAA